MEEIPDRLSTDLHKTSLTIIDESVAEERRLKTFGEAKIVTLGTVVKCGFANVSNVIVEDTEIGPRDYLYAGFPERLKKGSS